MTGLGLRVFLEVSMNKHVLLISVRVLVFFGLVSTGLAVPKWEELIVGVGTTEILDTRRDAVYSVEVRFTPAVWELRPWVYMSLTGREAFYVGAGMAYVWESEGRWRVGVGIGPGYYNMRNGMDLGGKYQNLSFIEGAYKFENGMKLGARFSHLSNAGVRSRNPGTEQLMLQVSWPIQ